MGRLVVVALALAILALAAFALAEGVRRRARGRAGGPGDTGFEGTAMQRMSYFLLLALIVYAAIWGGG